MSNFYNLIIKYRLPVALALAALGILVNVTSGFWPAFPLYFIALILLFGYFFFGPLRLIQEHFDLRPAAIIEHLDMRRPIYRQTAAYGHFGRNDLDLPWERTDKAAVLASAAGVSVPNLSVVSAGED